MDLFTFIIIVVFLTGVVGPLTKGFARRLGKGGDPADVRKLQSVLEQTEQRLTEAERRLSEAEQRLDFQEKLLASRPANRPRLGDPG